MSKRVLARVSLITLCSCHAVLASATSAHAQTPSGQARAAQLTTFGILGVPTTTTVADTGTLSDGSDIRETSQPAAAIPSVLTATTVHAVTIGWPDAVASETSLADLALNIAGSTIGAGFVMSRAAVEQGSGAVGAVSIDGLSVNGLAIAVTGSRDLPIGSLAQSGTASGEPDLIVATTGQIPARSPVYRVALRVISSQIEADAAVAQVRQGPLDPHPVGDADGDVLRVRGRHGVRVDADADHEVVPGLVGAQRLEALGQPRRRTQRHHPEVDPRAGDGAHHLEGAGEIELGEPGIEEHSDVGDVHARMVAQRRPWQP